MRSGYKGRIGVRIGDGVRVIWKIVTLGLGWVRVPIQGRATFAGGRSGGQELRAGFQDFWVQIVTLINTYQLLMLNKLCNLSVSWFPHL